MIYEGPCPSPTRSFVTGNYVSCKRRSCVSCGTSWARAWSIVMRENLRHYGSRVVMLTVTPPGVDRLPWDRDHCAHRGPHTCSGRRGCVVEKEAGDAWASSAPARWTELRQAARRVCRYRGQVPNLLARVWEPQKRGVPHLHIVFGCNSAGEEEAARAFLAELARLAPDYNFGLEGLDDDHFNPVPPEKVANYVSSYLTGRRGKKGTIRENIAHPRMPRSLLWVSAKLTRETLVTMRTLRYARWYMAALRGRIKFYPRLYRDALFEVAAACARLDRAKGPPGRMVPVETRRGRVDQRGDPVAPLRFQVPSRIVENLRLMRRLAEAAS